MKAIMASKRIWHPSSSFGDEYLGIAVITKDVVLGTGNKCRGPERIKTFKAGTKIFFELRSYKQNDKLCTLEIKVIGDEKFSMVVKLDGTLDELANKYGINNLPDYFKNRR